MAPQDLKESRARQGSPGTVDFRGRWVRAETRDHRDPPGPQERGALRAKAGPRENQDSPGSQAPPESRDPEDTPAERGTQDHWESRVSKAG